MKYILNNCTDPHWNMAHDEFLLEGLTETVFCLWQNAPSVIIGLNQNAYTEVNLPFLEEKGIVLARRVTGGGAVYHDLGNLNYSIAGPVAEIEKKQGLMTEKLREMGVDAVMSGRNDILVDGRKCSGYAKRLSKGRSMIHGTLLWDVDMDTLAKALTTPESKLQAKGVASVPSRVMNLRERLPQFPDIAAFRNSLQEMMAEGDAELHLTPAQKEAIDLRSREKFRRWEWNLGHSPTATFVKRGHFPCGSIELRYTLSRGLLTQLHFSGDFLGKLPVDGLCTELLGKRPEALLTLPVEEYFDNTSATELLQLFR